MAQSPSVTILERDMSSFTVTSADTVLAILGFATKGPIGIPTMVTSKKEFCIISKLIYPCTVLKVPEKVTSEVELLLKNFFWNWKQPKIKKDFLVRKIKDGGIKFPCIYTKIISWHLGWAIRCLKNEPLKPFSFFLFFHLFLLYL